MSTVLTRGRRFGIALSAVTTLGCQEPLNNDSIVPCTGVVTISVNTAPKQPQFSWTPACSVSLLLIMSAPASGPPTEHWRVQADRTVIIPPVTYGRLPTGAQTFSFIPLASNQDYHISIFVPDRSTPVGNTAWHQP